MLIHIRALAKLKVQVTGVGILSFGVTRTPSSVAFVVIERAALNDQHITGNDVESVNRALCRNYASVDCPEL